MSDHTRSALEPHEKLSVAYHHLVLGVPQQTLASIFVINSGRINEAVQAARSAFDFPSKETSSVIPNGSQ